MKSLKRTVGMIVLSGTAAASALASTSAPALAGTGWNPLDIIISTVGATSMTPAQITQETLANWVHSFTTWLLGIAIVLFVLKVVMTAIDRLVFDNQSDKKTLGANAKGMNGGGVLCQIPLIGAYDPTMAWKDIFIHFGKNLAIVAGAWVIVQIVTGIVLWVLSSLFQA